MDDGRERFADIEPTKMTWSAEGHAEIMWSDGHLAVYTPAYLRSICPCADCKGTHGAPPKAFNIVTDKQLKAAPLQTILRGVEPVGHYAMAFLWADGHKEGIYTWPYLRAKSPSA